MSLKSIIKKLARLKQRVQIGSKFDKRNIADDVKKRSRLVESSVARTSRIFLNQVIGEDISVMPEEVDMNRQSALAIQQFVFTSVEANPSANLITLEILEGSAEAIEVIDNHISITIDTDALEESTHTSVKALIDGDAQASSLITVAINAGQGATLVTAEEVSSFSGAL